MTKSHEPNSFVAVLMGSDSDLGVMQSALDTLDSLGIRWEARILSAHRTPVHTKEYVHDAESRGCAAFIAGAGLAAHLAGAIAASTLRPVIGVPLDAGGLGGMDALLATVQMPGGIPVACVAIGKPGAKNAAYLAAQIMALGNDEIFEALREDRTGNMNAVREKDRLLVEKTQN